VVPGISWRRLAHMAGQKKTKRKKKNQQQQLEWKNKIINTMAGT